jgi:hypothetical protein
VKTKIRKDFISDVFIAGGKIPYAGRIPGHVVRKLKIHAVTYLS